MRCCKCRNTQKNYHTLNTESEEQLCKVCDSFRWNYLGVSTEIRDKDIGSSWFNHCGSGFLSWIWLLLLTSATIANVAIITGHFLETDLDVVHTLSWTGTTLLLFIAPMACLVSAVHHTFPSIFPGQWARAVDIEFLICRLRFINMKRKKYGGYLAFLIGLVLMTVELVRLCAPFFNKDLVTAIATNHTLEGLHSSFPLTVFITVEGYINFVGFCFIIYLLRCSYESEVALVTKFLKQNIDNVDLCRARLAESFDAFHIFREFSSGWIALNLILSTVCILLELHFWITSETHLVAFQYQHTFLLLAFLMGPILSIGNVDCDYIWNRLLRNVSRQRTVEKEESWNKLMQFLNEQKAGQRPWQAVLAFILSTIAIFAAIQFRLWTNQNKVITYIVIDKNGTMLNIHQIKGYI